ncbi:hypothetical protein LX32DRAFT_639440 [Colletotrichum zoysiae]|uniref:RNA polymerase II transcription factor B subunit 2 n=1 Tax=Colletotrichum zoysiae TaxID=1216348 RepID=A0AAD9HJ63_9PEZI|nr:hypothetical protein LX32DRAFT_639440 [Colletotrichum zoysiae]
MPKPILMEDLDVWVKPELRRQTDQAISTLRSHILQITVPSKERPQEIQLTTNFKNLLRLALEGGGKRGELMLAELMKYRVYQLCERLSRRQSWVKYHTG